MKRFQSVLLIVATALLAPAAVWAHSHLESSVPAKDSTLQVSPGDVMLMFSDAVELTKLTLQKSGDTAKKDLAPLPQTAMKHLMVPLPKLAAGQYTLAYTVVSSDLHESSGTITFKVAASTKP